jgi:hypothetical protein
MCSWGLIALRWSASPPAPRDRLDLSVQATRLRLLKCQTLSCLSRQQLAEAGSISRTTGADCSKATRLRAFQYSQSSGNPEVCAGSVRQPGPIMRTAIAATAVPLPSISMQERQAPVCVPSRVRGLGQGWDHAARPPSRPVRSGQSSTWERAESGPPMNSF